MISVNDFRTGITIQIDNDLFQVVEFLHVKPGKGSAFVRSKLKNVRTGYVVEKTFRGGEKVQSAFIETRRMQFLYRNDDEFNFMDNENFEQIAVTAAQIGDGVKWLKDGTECDLKFHGTEILGVELPNFMELEVTQTDPGFKGDTATGAVKPATLETGAVVNVPLFVEIGDRLQIDTRTGDYLRRV
ncbi:elongation factor P [bacterium CPR1]|nr:elongation factor P [bacterium CPR1]